MTDRLSSEYDTIKKKLPDILDAISDAPATIPQLSVRLFARDLIPKAVKTEVDNAAISPYEKANKLVTAVHSRVEFQPEAFYIFVEILRQCGLALIATALEEDCRRKGEKQSTPVSTAAGDNKEPIEHLLNKEPIPRDLAVWLIDVEPKWSKLGELLGVREPRRESLERMHISDGERLSKVLEMWRSGITSDYTIRNLCECLTHMDKKDIVKKIRDELQKPEVAERYSKQPDYKP